MEGTKETYLDSIDQVELVREDVEEGRKIFIINDKIGWFTAVIFKDIMVLYPDGESIENFENDKGKIELDKIDISKYPENERYTLEFWRNFL